MNIRVASRKPSAPRTIRSLKKLAQKILLELERPDAELGLFLVGDRTIRRLNRIHRGKDAATDVLSYSLDLSDRIRGRGGPPRQLGDVVISIDTADRQGRERGHGLLTEMAELLIHGILHLAGYDHEKPKEARRMQAAEKRLKKRCWDE